MEYNIKEAVKEKCRITFEKIIDKSPYFPYQTFKVELIKEATSFLEKIKPRVDLSVNTSEKDIRTGIDSSIDIANLTQSQINAVYLHLIETVDYLNEIKPKTVSAPEFEFKNIFDPENAKPKFEFENNFDPENAKPKKVYDYFKKELVDAGYLSLEDLEKYLIMAFQDKTAPSERFSFAKKIKVKKAHDIFYRYYTVITNAGNGNKMKYAELLGNYFTGYIAKKVYNNF
ncbi:TPA: hypothetical protein ACT5CJ_002359 [Flavobacterium psychrophilum]